MAESKPRKRTPAKKTGTAKKAAPAKRTTKKATPPPPPDHEVEETEEWQPEPKKSRRKKPFISAKGLRDSSLFLGGMAGVFYETVFTKADRPMLLLLFAAMMGLPAFLRTDESQRG